MRTACAQHITDRLEKDGLYNLCKILLDRHSIIAGSYTLLEEPNDLDLWIPFGRGSNNSLGRVLTALLADGYRKITSRKQRSTNNAYKRMGYMIDTIYTISAKNRRHIQILLLTEAGGRTGEGVIEHFDLNLNRQYYDGTFLYTQGPTQHITINTESHVIAHQTFPEWVRTMSRIKKYMGRGYLFDSTQIEHMSKSLLPALRSYLNWSQMEKGFQLNDIDRWNRMAADTAGLPYITYTVRPPGKYISDISLFLCSKPTHTDIHYYGKHYTELTTTERKTLIKPSGNTGLSQSMYLAYNRSIHISSLLVATHGDTDVFWGP